MPINNRPLLQGVRVLDLTHVVSGPYATRYLALLGAEIIKIENPKTGGDMARFTGPLVNDCSVRFCSLNHNKRSIRLDLSRPEGRDVFLQLVEKADVVVDNFKPGTMEKLGITHLFQGHMCFGDTGTDKGTTIRILMEKHGIENAVYIGDTQGDYEAAVKAELPFIWVTYGFGVPADYQAKVDSFPELTTLF